jgi:hypothetical protein
LWRSLTAQFAVALAEMQLHRIPRIAVAIAHLLENFALSRWKRSLPAVSSRDIRPGAMTGEFGLAYPAFPRVSMAAKRSSSPDATRRCAQVRGRDASALSRPIIQIARVVHYTTSKFEKWWTTYKHAEI